MKSEQSDGSFGRVQRVKRKSAFRSDSGTGRKEKGWYRDEFVPLQMQRDFLCKHT